MLENIEVICNSCIRIEKEKIIYIDPYKIDRQYNDADLIFITHGHQDHYSEEDIDKVKNQNSKFIATKDVVEKLLEKGINKDLIIIVEPEKEYIVDNINFKTISAYNIGKEFHLKEKGWVGYIIKINDIIYYISGDTDITEENKKIKCDIAFVAVGGTYTMDYKEASDLINIIKPKYAIPTHYGSVVGTEQDAIQFISLLDSKIKGEILMK